MATPSSFCIPFVRRYAEANPDLLAADPDFATWLETEYRPIEGGWQY